MAKSARETARKRASMRPRQGLLTPLSCPARPLSRGRAAVAPKSSSSSSSSRQRGGGILRAAWRFVPALWVLILLRSPGISVFVDVDLFSGDWGVIVAQPAAAALCAYLSKACPPPLTLSDAYAEQSVPKSFRMGLTPSLKPQVMPVFTVDLLLLCNASALVSEEVPLPHN